MGAWYTIGLCLGIGLGIGVILAAVAGAGLVRMVAAAVLGAAVGAGAGLLIGDLAETIAGAAGGAIGVLSAAAVLLGALRRGGTRGGLALFIGLGGFLVALVALIPVAGYLEALALPLLASRLRGRQAARYAGLRTLAR